MKTIIYNTTTQAFITGIYTDFCRNADSQIMRITDPYVQLQYITTEPTHNPETQVATLTFTIVVNPEPHNPFECNGTATETWIVRDKTACELARETWHFVTPMRIHASRVLLTSQLEMGVLLALRNIQRVETETGFYLYVNEIAPGDEATYAYLLSAGLITVENYPTEPPEII